MVRREFPVKKNGTWIGGEATAQCASWISCKAPTADGLGQRQDSVAAVFVKGGGDIACQFQVLQLIVTHRHVCCARKCGHWIMLEPQS